ncbi:MAG: cupin domain-containing protein [Kordiimonadaceae bacterium]|nr:cupin domain-containing protein [Kordiimonadaceae bacterium]MBO6568165.1 cupin domain-containing protein [Kordiimonadaceae bacterium]MBO6964105.1 cupin domain-containing protein [Kordiimonadaceae bacterium]
MELNADFDARAAVHSEQLEWRASPMKGVSRRMLDRIGDEVARATTIVRYDPGSHFSAHTHTGGEEYIVLDGVFQDEHGDFPVGSYVRNPPTSSHTPRSDPGTVIFVKLWQFDMADRTHVNINMNEAKAAPAECRDGVEILPLHRDDREDVRMERWAAGATVTVDTEGGAEFLVLDGSFEESGETFEKHSWLRVPKGYDLSIVAGENGARVWVKTGHLDYVITPDQVA